MLPKCYFIVRAGVNKREEVQFINHNIYEDSGYKINETFAVLGRLTYSKATRRNAGTVKFTILPLILTKILGLDHHVLPLYYQID